MYVDADIDEDGTANDATEAEDAFDEDDFDNDFDMKETSARTPDRRRTSVSTKMLACVEAESALEQAVMAADLALEKRSKGNTSVDFTAEIADLESALARALPLFDNDQVTSKFFSADHVVEIHKTIDRARNNLRQLNGGDIVRHSVMKTDPEPGIMVMSAASSEGGPLAGPVP